MKPLTYRTFATLLDGTEEEVVCEFDYSPGDPGRTYGPPEKCYPPEPAELDITAVQNLAGDDITDQVSVEELEKLSERIYDNAHKWMPQAEERDYDY